MTVDHAYSLRLDLTIMVVGLPLIVLGTWALARAVDWFTSVYLGLGDDDMTADKALAVIGGNAEIAEEEITALANQVQPLWPKELNAVQAKQLAQLALMYGLDPMRGELMPYQGKPYVTVDGYLRIADRHPAYDGFDHDPATEEERQALGAAEDEVIWTASVYRKDRGRPVRMYGRAGGENERNPLVSGKTKAGVVIQPTDQALIRALRRALRASLSIPLPGDDDSRVTNSQLRAIHAIDQERGVDREQRHHELREVYDVEHSGELTKDQASGYIDGRLVDTDTGEVIFDGASKRLGKVVTELGLTASEVEQLAISRYGFGLSTLDNEQMQDLIVAIEEQAESHPSSDAVRRSIEEVAEEAELGSHDT